MNPHQLELFYHVAIHRGVSPAAKALGKEQPTLSKQINDLEDHLRVKLYHRRPFHLTEKGEELFAAIESFFRDLPRLEQKVRGGELIRIGSSPLFLADHLPAVEKQVRRQFPKTRLVLREANQPALVDLVEREEIDLAITILPQDPPRKVFCKLLLTLPMILLVPKSHRLRAARELWLQPEIREDLICLPGDEIICREFQRALQSREVEWRPRIEVGSLSLVERYVEEGYGIGLSVRVPGARLPRGLRAVNLDDFPTMPLGLMWRDNEDRLTRAFREEVERRAARFSATSA